MTAVSEQPPPASPLALDRDRLCRLVHQHQADLWRYVRYLGAQATEADDLVQETFLSLARSGFDERSDGETASLLRTAARNQLLMLRRRERRAPPHTELEAAEAVWVNTLPDGRSEPLLDALRDCVAGLEGRSGQIIQLHYTQKLSRDEAAKQLGMSTDGIKTLLRRTRAVLKECVERRMK